MKKIVYTNNEGNVFIVIPTIKAIENYTLQVVAEKNVPEGIPFWIVDNSEIPTDRTFRDAWELPDDYREPDGYGSVYTSFKEIEDAEN